jgi:hypothetical protein
MVHQFEALEIGKGGTVVYEGTVYKVPGLNEIDPTLSQFRVDHLVPLDLGGAASDPRNLWVEPLEAPAGQAPVGMGAQTKIRVDHYLHQMVCSGHMKLQAAQEGIINDWAQFIGAKVSS